VRFVCGVATVVLIAASLAGSAAGQVDPNDPGGAREAAFKKPIDVKGKISDDGKMFISDKDSKSWTIVNPDAVKGHEGHHVILNVHVYVDKKEIRVMSMKMLK
jgi:hypothetical protein